MSTKNVADKPSGQLTKTTTEGVIKSYAYDLAGNLLSDGEYTYTYDLQNRLLTKKGTDGETKYEYDNARNLMKETAPDGTVSYTYNAQNKLIKGEKDTGESSGYTYNALGARIENVQVRKNENAGHQNADLNSGSKNIPNYLKAFSDLRAIWQRAWETEVGTVAQNDFETVTKHYVVDLLSVANRDILVTEDGSFTQRYVYDANGKRLSAEFAYADGTERGTTNAKGEYGENPQSDIAVGIGKVWYRTSHLNSTLFAVDKDGDVIAHAIYDPWGKPLTETYTDTNYSGLDNLNNFTGYTWDETLELYFAQNRFYDAEEHRFTQEDIVKDGWNWYVYCGNGPTVHTDVWGHASNPYNSIIWDELSSYNDDGKYYSVREVFEQLGGDVNYDKKSNTTTVTYTYDGKTIQLYYDMADVPREPYMLFLTRAIEGAKFKGKFSGAGGDATVKLLYSREYQKAYISSAEIKDYFSKVWCEEENKSKVIKQDEPIDQIVKVNDWLILHSVPSGSSNNFASIPDEAKTSSNWYSFENRSNPDKAMGEAKKQIGKTDIVHKGDGGEFTDNEGRYWVAVGPKVLNPNYPDNGHIWADEFVYGTKIDAVFTEISTGKKYYLYCVVGDIKAHTYPNGIYQTGVPYPNSWNASIGKTGDADHSVIEFIGKGSTSGLSNYRIESIIVY